MIVDGLNHKGQSPLPGSSQLTSKFLHVQLSVIHSLEGNAKGQKSTTEHSRNGQSIQELWRYTAGGFTTSPLMVSTHPSRMLRKMPRAPPAVSATATASQLMSRPSGCTVEALGRVPHIPTCLTPSHPKNATAKDDMQPSTNHQPFTTINRH